MICYGCDGHIEIEYAQHDQCQCAKDSTDSSSDTISSFDGHSHCKDFAASASLIAPSQKNIKRQIQSLQNLVITILSSCDENEHIIFQKYYKQSSGIFTFCDSLRTVILIA
ncbi:MAG: hypothetical protein ACIAQZ_05440 [Sedimentisphaeraceae bacterium JB056]